MGFKAAVLAGAFAAAVGFGSASAAGLVNGSFEEGGGFDGWTVSHPDLAASSFLTLPFAPDGSPIDGAYGPYTPRADWLHAVLTTGEAYNPDTGAGLTLITQTFDVASPVHLRGWAAFLGGDYIDPNGELEPLNPGIFNDFAFVRVVGLAGPDMHTFDVLPAFYADIATAPNSLTGPTSRGYGYTPWTRFDVALTTPGSYRVEIGVANAVDNRNDSRLLVDGLSLSVPEPSAWALLITGFFGMGALLRARRPKAVPVRVRRDRR